MVFCKRSLHQLLFLAALCAILAQVTGCGGGSGSGSTGFFGGLWGGGSGGGAVVLRTIVITPTHSVCATDTNWQFTATGTYSDRSTQDLTASVTWTSSDTNVATIDDLVNKGLATPVSVGQTTITAALGSISGTTTLAIKDILDAGTIPKFVDSLPIPSVMPSVRPDYYEVKMEQIQTQVLPAGFPASTRWGYGPASGQVSVPGPTFIALKGAPIRVKYINNLPPDHIFPVDVSLDNYMFRGMPENRVVVHLHGGVVPPDSDGYPDAWFTAGNMMKGPNWVQDTYTYPNNQDPCTLWYHDHSHDLTHLNPLAGLAGFYLLIDPADPLNGQLPNGAYQLGLALQDQSFFTDGSLYYETDPPEINPGIRIEPSMVPEHFGNTITVNGKTWPYLEVEPRKYRFRLLNASNARFYHLKTVIEPAETSPGPKFIQVGSEQGYLEKPLNLDDILIAPGERMDFVMDFSTFNGQTILVTNDAPTPFDGGDPVTADTAKVMQFRVTKPLAAPDTSVIPVTIRSIPRLSPTVAAQNIALIELMDEFGRIMPTLNMAAFMDPVTEKPKLGTTQVWRWINCTPDWHPLHMHLVKFQTIDRIPFANNADWAVGDPAPPPGTNYKADYALAKQNGTPLPDVTQYYTGPPIPVPPTDPDYGWKDTVKTPPNFVTEVIAKFEGYAGLYVYHCHILDHEEHDMMRPMEVVP